MTHKVDCCHVLKEKVISTPALLIKPRNMWLSAIIRNLVFLLCLAQLLPIANAVDTFWTGSYLGTNVTGTSAEECCRNRVLITGLGGPPTFTLNSGPNLEECHGELFSGGDATFGLCGFNSCSALFPFLNSHTGVCQTEPSNPMKVGNMIGPPPMCVGNPIEAATGNKFQQETDIAVSNNNLRFSRYYNSIEEDSAGALIIDGKWTFDYFQSLSVNNVLVDVSRPADYADT